MSHRLFIPVHTLCIQYPPLQAGSWPRCESGWCFGMREFCGENERAGGSMYWQKAGSSPGSGKELLQNKLPVFELRRKKAPHEPNKNMQFTAFIDRPDSVWMLEPLKHRLSYLEHSIVIQIKRIIWINNSKVATWSSTKTGLAAAWICLWDVPSHLLWELCGKPLHSKHPWGREHWFALFKTEISGTSWKEREAPSPGDSWDLLKSEQETGRLLEVQSQFCRGWVKFPIAG